MLYAAAVPTLSARFDIAELGCGTSLEAKMERKDGGTSACTALGEYLPLHLANTNGPSCGGMQ